MCLFRRPPNQAERKVGTCRHMTKSAYTAHIEHVRESAGVPSARLLGIGVVGYTVRKAE